LDPVGARHVLAWDSRDGYVRSLQVEPIVDPVLPPPQAAAPTGR
jgi:hypothetical protein